MEYIKVNQLSMPVSRIIYGTAIKKLMDGESADDLLDIVLAEGINTFDTARSYGKSENELGKWIQKRGNRSKINIMTKGCNPQQTGLTFSPESLREELNQSLSALRTDYVDSYALHRDVQGVDVSIFIETLNEFKAEGKIRVLGASNWNYRRMEEANEYAYAHQLEGFSFGSPAFSLAEVVGDPWGDSIHISGKSNDEARTWFGQNKIPVFAYSSFARGFFSGKYRTDMGTDLSEVLPSWACEEYVCEENIERLRRAEQLSKEKNATVGQINLAWILSQPFVVCPILSPSTPDHLLENLKGMKLHLTEQEIDWLNLL